MERIPEQAQMQEFQDQRFAIQIPQTEEPPLEHLVMVIELHRKKIIQKQPEMAIGTVSEQLKEIMSLHVEVVLVPQLANRHQNKDKHKLAEQLLQNHEQVTTQFVQILERDRVKQASVVKLTQQDRQRYANHKSNNLKRQKSLDLIP